MKRSIVLAKREVTFGDNTLVLAAADALLLSDFKMERYAGERKERNHDHAGLGNQAEVNVDPHTMSGFAMEAAPSESPGVAPANGHIIEACGFDETVVAVTSVTYDIPDTPSALRTGRASLGIEEYDPDTGLKQATFGAMGSLAIKAARQDYLMWEVSAMRGTSEGAPVSGTPPTISQAIWDTFKKPIPFIKNHIKTAVVDGFTVCPLSFEYDWGMQLANLGTCDQVFYAEYAPSLSMTVKAPTLTDKNFWTNLVDEAPVAVTLKVADSSDTAGKRISIINTSVQITAIDDKGLEEGVRVLAITGKPLVQASILLD